jgi:hypothetical protein
MTAPTVGPRDKREDDDPSTLPYRAACGPRYLRVFLSLENAMRPDVEAMKADIEQSVALLRRRL